MRADSDASVQQKITFAVEPLSLTRESSGQRTEWSDGIN